MDHPAPPPIIQPDKNAIQNQQQPPNLGSDYFTKDEREQLKKILGQLAKDDELPEIKVAAGPAGTLVLIVVALSLVMLKSFANRIGEKAADTFFGGKTPKEEDTDEQFENDYASLMETLLLGHQFVLIAVMSKPHHGIRTISYEISDPHGELPQQSQFAVQIDVPGGAPVFALDPDRTRIDVQLRRMLHIARQLKKD